MQIEKLDPKTVRMIEAEVKNLLPSLASKLGLEVRLAGGKYNDQELTLKVSIKTPLKVSDHSMDTDSLSYGLAPRGTPAIFSDGREVVIEDAKRSKYVFHFKENPTKKYVARFGSFKALPGPQPSAMDGVEIA